MNLRNRWTQKRFVRSLIVALTYFLGAKIGLSLNPVSGFATLVWPPAGIGLAALVLFGNSLWPGIALGAFSANIANGAPLLTASGIAAGNTMEALLGAWLLRNSGFQPSLERLKDLIMFILFACGASTLAGAIAGTLSLWIGGVGGNSGGFEGAAITWRAWWVGDALGDLIVAPLIFAWAKSEFKGKFDYLRTGEIAAFAAALFFVVSFVMTDVSRLMFWFFPFVIWAALRYGQRGNVTALFVIALVAVWKTTDGRDELYLLASFLFVVAVTGMTLAATATERMTAIKDKKVLEDVLQKEERYRLMVEVVKDYAIFMLDPMGNVITWNEGAKRFKGYEAGEIIGRNFSQFYTSDDIQDAKPERDLALARNNGRFEDEGWRVRKDGSHFWASIVITPIYDKAGAHAGFSKVTRDLTELKRSIELRTRELVRLNKNAKLLAESSKVLSSSLDFQTTLRQITKTAVPELADLCAVDILEGGSIRRVAVDHADPEIAARIQEPLQRLRPHWNSQHLAAAAMRDGETKLIPEFNEASAKSHTMNDEHYRLLEELNLKTFMSVPMFAGGKVVGAITFGSSRPGRRYETVDIELAEEIARRAAIAIENATLYGQIQRAVKVRDDFLSIASHELRTPLTSLYLQLQMIKRSLSAGGDKGLILEKVAAKIGASEKQAKQLGDLIDILLDVSRLGADKLPVQKRTANLSAVVKDVVDRFAEEAVRAGSVITFRRQADVIGNFDKLRIGQAVNNLLSNAIKYGAGKPIDVTVDVNKDSARIFVEDHGMGIAGHDQTRIFERFERAVSHHNISGLGLGLFITREIVAAHGGKIMLDSEPGRGSIFILEFPLENPAAPRLNSPGPEEVRRHEKRG